MFAHFLARTPVINRRRSAYPAPFSRLLSLGLVLAALGGCGALPPAPIAGPDPADADARVPPVGYRSTVGPYQRAVPAAAGSWQQQNEQIAPQVKP